LSPSGVAAATGSYVQLSPDNKFVYSAGGPTGEVHAVDQATGGFGDKLQELLYVPEDELATADKTRKALVSHPAPVKTTSPVVAARKASQKSA
jgi:hypothetical protein